MHKTPVGHRPSVRPSVRFLLLWPLFLPAFLPPHPVKSAVSLCKRQLLPIMPFCVEWIVSEFGGLYRVLLPPLNAPQVKGRIFV